jgi:hypothetical protein
MATDLGAYCRYEYTVEKLITTHSTQHMINYLPSYFIKYTPYRKMCELRKIII